MNTDPVHKYMVSILTGGSATGSPTIHEVSVEADFVKVAMGDLLFTIDGVIVAVFASGLWSYAKAFPPDSAAEAKAA